jgi:DNA polymerase-3 subunit epsilon
MGESIRAYCDPEFDRWKTLVSDARSLLASLEAELAKERAKVNQVQTELFLALRPAYQERDRLRLIVHYRQKFLDAILHKRPDEAHKAAAQLELEMGQVDRDYEELAASSEKKRLSADTEAELSSLWKKLVKLYHPDRFANEPEKLETYQKLTTAINEAKLLGNIQILREIADDPNGFILRKGWLSVDLGERDDLAYMRNLHEALLGEIESTRRALDGVRETPDYELWTLSNRGPGFLGKVVSERGKQIQEEIHTLKVQAYNLAKSIERISGKRPEGTI